MPFLFVYISREHYSVEDAYTLLHTISHLTMGFTDDFAISRDMCSLILSDIQHLLDIAKTHGGSQNEYPGATYLTRSLAKSLKKAQHAKKQQLGRLKRKQLTIDTGESDAGPTSDLALKRKRASRNDARKHAENPSSSEDICSSDSDVPIWRQFSLPPPSAITQSPTPNVAHPITSHIPRPTSLVNSPITPSTPQTSSAPVIVISHNSEGESEAPLSDLERESRDVSESGNVADQRLMITALPRLPPKKIRQFIIKLSLFSNEDLAVLLERLVEGLKSLSPQETPKKPSNLGEMAALCADTEQDVHVHSFLHMRTLLQFVLWTERYDYQV